MTNHFDESGSLALEQVLFIAAVVGMSVGLFAFYEDLRSYFESFSIQNLPTQINLPTARP